MDVTTRVASLQALHSNLGCGEALCGDLNLAVLPGSDRVLSSGTTDESGVLDGIVLPAPDAALAQTPTGEMPYALYDIRVSHPDYRTEIYKQVPIFPDVKSIQPVQFLSDHTN